MKKLFLLIGIIILMIFASRHYNKNIKTKPQPIDPKPVTDTITVDLYFRDVEKLVKEERQINVKPEDNIPKKVIQELMKGPNSKGLSPTIPEGAKLNSININGTTAIVDFSNEFINNHSGGSEAENLTIYSVVNTLADLININKVEFLIDGEKRKIFKHFTLDDTFTKDQSLIKQ